MAVRLSRNGHDASRQALGSRSRGRIRGVSLQQRFGLEVDGVDTDRSSGFGAL